MSKVRCCTLFSGSSANATYIEADGRGILIDAGAGVRKTENALRRIGSSLSKIDAVFITHEHSDHINGLSTILKQFRIPIIANEKTLNALYFSCPDVDENLFRNLPTGSKAVKDSFEITSFATHHDSVESVGYIINTEKMKIGVLTDSGELNNVMKRALYGCNVVVLESNHDTDMLKDGPYPQYLKKRILGEQGHLSNNQCACGLCEIIPHGTEKIFLAHLSKENNTPELAYDTVSVLLSKSLIKCGKDISLEVAPRETPSGIWER